MADTRRTRLQMVALEDRTVPALVIDLNGAGALTGVREADTGQTDGAILSVLPGNQLNVREGAVDYGTFPVAKTLRIELGTHSTFMDNQLLMNDSLLKTNLRVDLRGDVTEFDVLGGTTGLATIDGNIHIQGGEFRQLFVFGELFTAKAHVTNVTGSITADLGPGGDDDIPDVVGTVGSPPAPSSANVGGNVTVRNSTIFVWAGRIGGNLTLESAKPVDQQVYLGNYNRPMSVGGNVSVRTGTGNDHVAFQSTLFRHNAAVDTGDGDDLLELGIGDDDKKNVGFNDAPATVLGNLTVDLGTGNDKAYFGADSLTHPGQTDPLTVGGNLVVDAGAGDDQLFFPDARVQGRSISVDTGDGNDEVKVAKLIAPRAQFSVDLGTGDDLYGFTDNATVSLKRAVIDGGTGDDVYAAGTGNDFDFDVVRTSI